MIPAFDLDDFFEITPDLVWIAGKDGFLKKVNAAVIKKLGYSEAELYARPISVMIHPEDREITLLNRFKLFGGEVLHDFCNRYITASGDVIWLEWTSVYVAEKEIVFAVAKDITARKKIEKEVEEKYKKYKSLATHFKSSIENDRKYFAYELHEELAQLISVVNLDLGWLAGNTPEYEEKFKEKINHALAVSKLLIKTIQRLSFTISPQMLDKFGIGATLEWLCTEFKILNGIECSFKGDYDEKLIPREIKIDIFRFCQEALSTVLNIDEAVAIKINIEEKENTVRLALTDIGNGFGDSSETQQAGMKNLHIRADSISAVVALVKNENIGTGVYFSIDKKLMADIL